MFDRLGAGHQLSVGYRGTRDLIFDIGNLFMAEDHEPNRSRADARHMANRTHVGTALRLIRRADVPLDANTMEAA